MIRVESLVRRLGLEAAPVEGFRPGGGGEDGPTVSTIPVG